MTTPDSHTRPRGPTGEEFYAARFAARLTQEAAAAMLGKSVRTVQDWENARRNCDWGTFQLFLLLIQARRAARDRSANGA